MIPDVSPDPLSTPLFAEDIPVEMVLRIAHILYGPDDDDPANVMMDLAIGKMLALSLHRLGADRREIPWPMRLEIVRLTGKPEVSPLRRPNPPEPPR